MKHSTMQHGANPSMGMEGHNHHAMMIADFKKRFYVVLVFNCSRYAAVKYDTALAEYPYQFYRLTICSFASFISCVFLWRLAVFKRIG